MPPKIRITKENIVERAVEIVREHGMDSLNARSLAKELGCSVQPIFRAFDSMGELRSISIYSRVLSEFFEGINFRKGWFSRTGDGLYPFCQRGKKFL